jgi:hypothetical protein
MRRGNISRRGKRSWRIKVEVGEKVHLLTVRGKRPDAGARAHQDVGRVPCRHACRAHQGDGRKARNGLAR